MDRGTGSGLSFAKRIYLPRSIGLGIGFFCVAAGLWPLYSTPWLWALLVFNGFLWPHLAYQLARRSAAPYQAERRNLLIDSVFGGFWAAAMQFNVLPSVTILAMMAMNNIAAGGGRFFARGCVAMLLGAGLAMLRFGPALAPDTSMPQLYACLPMLILYPLALGSVSYRLSIKLAEHKQALRAASRTDSLNQSLTRNDTETSKAQARVADAETRLRAQYAALDTKMASLTSLNTYITNQIAAWNKA